MLRFKTDNYCLNPVVTTWWCLAATKLAHAIVSDACVTISMQKLLCCKEKAPACK